jgi:hypothetical protein
MLLVSATTAQEPAATHAAADPKPANTAPQPPPIEVTIEASGKDVAKPATKRRRKKPPIPVRDWQQWVDTLTGDALDDDWRLSALDRALFQARLCAAWWPSNSIRAKGWCEEAVETVSRTPWNEQENARKERLGAARTVLRLVSSLDETLRAQVEDAIDLASEESSTARQRNELASTLAQAALDQAENPPRMAKLIADSLRHGGSPITVLAIAKLREKDPQRADELFDDAAVLAGGSMDPMFPAYLVTASFPGMQPVPVASPPEPWRLTALQAVARNVAIPPRSDAERDGRCTSLRQYLRSINQKYPGGVPAATLSQLDYCVPDISTQMANRPPLPENLKTSDDLLRAAKGYPDPRGRQELKISAAIRADRSEKNPARALEILETITPEEKAARPNLVRPLWLDVGSRAVIEALSKNEMGEVRDILYRTPEKWRAEVEVLVLEKAKGGRGLAEIISHCRHDLNRYGADDPKVYIRFLNLALKHRWPTRELILRETFHNLNGWKPKNPDTLQVNEMSYLPLERQVAPLPIVAEILELELESLRATATVIDKVALRKSFQLALLQPSLSRARELERAKKAREEALTSQSP